MRNRFVIILITVLCTVGITVVIVVVSLSIRWEKISSMNRRTSLQLNSNDMCRNAIEYLSVCDAKQITVSEGFYSTKLITDDIELKVEYNGTLDDLNVFLSEKYSYGVEISYAFYISEGDIILFAITYNDIYLTENDISGDTKDIGFAQVSWIYENQ